MRILLTRPESRCDVLSERLEGAGHEVICSPMLEIEFLSCPDIEVRSLQAIIITSANALRALERDGQISKLVDVPIYTVGAASGRLARSLGFCQVIEGPAGALELVEMICERLEPSGGRLLHLSGAILAKDMAAALTPLGFELTRAVVYRSEPAANLSPDAVKALKAGELDLVILMSPRTAKTFVRLICDAGLKAMSRRLNYACISETTAEELKALQLPDGHLHISPHPQGDDLIALVNGLVNRISPQ